MKTFNNIEEMKHYYNKQTNTYDFIEDNELIDVEFTFELTINANINACDINALDINARDINAENINAWDIKARNINALDINARDIKAKKISFYAVCFAYYAIQCTSIIGRRENAEYFGLDGGVTIKKD